jgi:hypothetical protein
LSDTGRAALQGYIQALQQLLPLAAATPSTRAKPRGTKLKTA